MSSRMSAQGSGGHEGACGGAEGSRAGVAGPRLRRFATPDPRLLVLSIAVQLAVGVLFGHSTDMRVFMATGYLVGGGHDPYVGANLVAVFHHAGFDVTSAIGYPPPWPLTLGLVYRASYAVVHNLLLYNLAIKLPLIAANVALAYLTGATVQSLGGSPAACRRAWVFMLLNPALLYFTAAWGQIDGIVALLSLGALVAFAARRWNGSAVLLALAFTFKPTMLPLAVLTVVSLAGRSLRLAARHAALFAAAVVLLYVGPFFALGWSRDPFTKYLNAHFTQQGTMSYMTIVRLVRGQPVLEGGWWLLGLIWAVALVVAVVGLRRGDGGLPDLLRKGTALILVVFLTRTWLAEANVLLVLPLVAILTALGDLDRRALTAIWVLPLAFTVFNSSPLHLLWVAFPGAMDGALAAVAGYGDLMLAVRAALVVAWQVAGWWIVVVCLRGRAAPGARRVGLVEKGAV